MCSRRWTVSVSAVTPCSFASGYQHFWENSLPHFYVIQSEVNRVFGKSFPTTKFYVTSISNNPAAFISNRTVEGN